MEAVGGDSAFAEGNAENKYVPDFRVPQIYAPDSRPAWRGVVAGVGGRISWW